MLLKHTVPMTALKRNIGPYLDQLKNSKDGLFIFKRNRPVGVLVSVDEYERLKDFEAAALAGARPTEERVATDSIVSQAISVTSQEHPESAAVDSLKAGGQRE